MSNSNSQILIVDDDNELREAIVDTLMITGYECLEAKGGEEALEILTRKKVDMVISDIQMGGMDGHTLLNSIHERFPQMPVLLMTAYANIDGAVRAMRDGAIDYLAKPFAPEVLLNQVSRYVPVRKIVRGEPVFADPGTAELLSLASRVAQSDATVMITGPSGSGKEVLSRYVHDKSNRADGPFVAINCAAIPDSMLEATLFGYEKGAFTGAVQACPGKFEQAQGGTLLLDEITEMDLALQAKLLRVLQEKNYDGWLSASKSFLLQLETAAGPRAAALHYGLSVAYAKMNRKADALRHARLAQQGASGHSVILDKNLAQVEFANASGKDGKRAALKLARETVDRYPYSLMAAEAYVDMLHEMGMNEQVVKFMRRQKAIPKDNTDYHALLARSYHELGRHAEAFAATGEMYAIAGNHKAAVYQFDLAQRANDADYYVMSMIDAKLREQRRLALDEEKARKGK